MPIATPEKYAEMLDTAKAKSFAFPAINVTSSQTLNAALKASPMPALTASSRSPRVGLSISLGKGSRRWWPAQKPSPRLPVR